MRKNISCIAFFTKHNNNEAKEVSIILKEKLVENGIKVIDYLLIEIFLIEIIITEKLIWRIAVGGDGTTLRTFRILAHGYSCFEYQCWRNPGNSF